MTRLALLLPLIVLMAGPARAESPQDRLVTALEADGYVILESERTWLGRLRIVAAKGDLRREVVINPGTGEVLRDIASEEGGRGSDDSPATASSTAVAQGDGSAASVTATRTEGDAATLGATSVEQDVLLPEAGVLQ